MSESLAPSSDVTWPATKDAARAAMYRAGETLLELALKRVASGVEGMIDRIEPPAVSAAKSRRPARVDVPTAAGRRPAGRGSRSTEVRVRDDRPGRKVLRSSSDGRGSSVGQSAGRVAARAGVNPGPGTDRAGRPGAGGAARRRDTRRPAAAGPNRSPKEQAGGGLSGLLSSLLRRGLRLAVKLVRRLARRLARALSRRFQEIASGGRVTVAAGLAAAAALLAGRNPIWAAIKGAFSALSTGAKIGLIIGLVLAVLLLPVTILLLLIVLIVVVVVLAVKTRSRHS